MVVNNLLLNFNSSNEIPEVIDMLLIYVVVPIYCSTRTLAFYKHQPKAQSLPGSWSAHSKVQSALAKLSSLRKMGAFHGWERFRYQGNYFQV